MNTKTFLDAWTRGRLCLHPTDTLPGLSFHPDSVEGKEALLRFKERDQLKPFIGLVSDPDQAQLWWQPLSDRETFFLTLLWPDSVSVVRPSGKTAPASMCSPQGELALRCPKWPEHLLWMKDVLRQSSIPFPTTSINKSGEPPATTRNEAVEMLKGQNVFIPDYVEPSQAVKGLPSTVIRIHGSDASPEILREGAVSSEHILKLWHQSQSKIGK